MEQIKQEIKAITDREKRNHTYPNGMIGLDEARGRIKAFGQSLESLNKEVNDILRRENESGNWTEEQILDTRAYAVEEIKSFVKHFNGE